eukprot:653331-Hanusia_phi.AAC.3
MHLDDLRVDGLKNQHQNQAEAPYVKPEVFPSPDDDVNAFNRNVTLTCELVGQICIEPPATAGNRRTVCLSQSPAHLRCAESRKHEEIRRRKMRQGGKKTAKQCSGRLVVSPTTRKKVLT